MQATETKQIAPQTLGRYRAEYDKMRKLGIAEDKIREAMSLHCQILGITLDEFDTQLAAMNRASVSGKREADAQWRKDMIGATEELCSHINAVRLTGKTNLKAFKSAVDKLAELAYYGKGGVALLAFPRLDLAALQNGKQELVNPDKLCQAFEAGWEDGSKNQRFQYAPREIPVSKASGYRAEHTFPIFAEPEKVSKGKGKESKAEIVEPENLEPAPGDGEPELSESES